MLFLQCLPRDIRVLLTHEDHRNLRLLANANTTAVGDFQTDPVAALPGKNTTASSKRSSRPHYRPKHSRGSQKEQYTSAPVALAKDPTGLCFYHWNFGDKANNCRPLLLAGKLVGWSIVGPVHPGKLALISDSSSGASFLVDTGSSYHPALFTPPSYWSPPQISKWPMDLVLG